MKDHQHNYFVTVTYAPEHVPKRIRQNTETGEITETNTLDKKDVTLFLKRLKEHFRDKFGHTGIRYFYCGEYGEKTERPHYHFIFFNMPLYDLKPFFLNHEGQQVYRSKLLEDKWKLGIVSVGEVTYQSAAYVARYILKKQTGEMQRKDREPEFTEMSRRPGIGKNYYLNHRDEIYKNDEVIIKARLGKVVAMKPPRYFDELYDLDNPDGLKEVKKHRRDIALMSRGALSNYTTLEMSDYLDVCERNKLNHLKMLKRKMREDV